MTDRPTNGRTDGRTDQRMDTPSYRDARTHLKMTDSVNFNSASTYRVFVVSCNIMNRNISVPENTTVFLKTVLESILIPIFVIEISAYWAD